VTARRAIQHENGGARRRTKAAALTAAAAVAVVVSFVFAGVAMATEPDSTPVSAGEHGKGKDKSKDDHGTNKENGKDDTGQAGTGQAGTGSDDKGDGGGDNGTVKIHAVGTPAQDHRNEPKVCVFYLDAFGFDAGQSVVWQISQHPPTGTAAAKAGAIVLNAQGAGQTSPMTLPAGHYKLAWKFTGENGSAKHKTFWVRCDSRDKPDKGGDKDDKCADKDKSGKADEKSGRADDKSGRADDKSGRKDDEKSGGADDKSGKKDDEKSGKKDDEKSGGADDKCDKKDDKSDDRNDDKSGGKKDDDKKSEVSAGQPTPAAQAAVKPSSEVSAEGLAKTGAQTPLVLGVAFALLAVGAAVFLATGRFPKVWRRH
jgi:hypothetical protein